MSPKPEWIDKLVADLASEDGVGRVLRCALYVEQQVNLFLETVLKNPAPLAGRLTFDQKLRVAEAMGMDHRICAAARCINKQRNAFAHDIDAKLDRTAMIDAEVKLESYFPGLMSEPLQKMGRTGTFRELAEPDMLTYLTFAFLLCCAKQIQHRGS